MLVTCGTQNFNYSDTDEIKFKGIPTYYCIQNKSKLEFGGTFLSSYY